MTLYAEIIQFNHAKTAVLILYVHLVFLLWTSILRCCFFFETFGQTKSIFLHAIVNYDSPEGDEDQKIRGGPPATAI